MGRGVKGLIFPSKHLQDALPPVRFAEQILEIEGELDQLHPAWRQPGRSRLGPRGIVGSRGIEDMNVKVRVKYLLQRRKHLYNGKDYEVVVKSIKQADGTWKMFAMPIIPRDEHTAESLAAASRLRMAGRSEQASLPQIAHRLELPLKVVEKLVLDAEPGANLFHHCRRKLAIELTTPSSETSAEA